MLFFFNMGKIKPQNLGICNAIDSGPPLTHGGYIPRSPQDEGTDCTKPDIFYVSPICTY